jgi:hypothetical protein
MGPAGIALEFRLENLNGLGYVGDIRHGWEDDIKFYLIQTVCEDVYWIFLVQDRVHWYAVVYLIINPSSW